MEYVVKYVQFYSDDAIQEILNNAVAKGYRLVAATDKYLYFSKEANHD